MFQIIPPSHDTHSKYFSRIIFLLPIILLGCNPSPQTAEGLATATLPVTITLTPKNTRTPTPTPSPTNTPAPTIDAFNQNTWPADMLEYYLNLDTDPAKNALLPLSDAEFHKMFVEAIRYGLQQKGITKIKIDGWNYSTSWADEDVLYWGYLQQAAKSRQEVYISLVYLQKIAIDYRLEDIPHWYIYISADQQAEYGLWRDWISNSADPTIDFDSWTFGHLQNFQYPTSMYGLPIIIPYFSSRTTVGDYAGFVHLPGPMDDYAILTRIKDQRGYSYLKINALAIQDPIPFDASMHSCIGTSNGAHVMYCPNMPVISRGGDARVYNPGWDNANIWPKEEWLARLDPEFNFSILYNPERPGSDPERKHIADFQGFLHPRNGLELLKTVVISVPDASGKHRFNAWPDPLAPNGAIPPNLLNNAGFETTGSGWFTDAWKGDNLSIFSWETYGCRSGKGCVSIQMQEANDARWLQTVSVTPNTDYILEGWVKSQNVISTEMYTRMGGNLGVMEINRTSGGIFDTNDWMRVSLRFNSGDNSGITVACRLGYYGDIVTGRIWCDDFSLREEY
jgi:hypothetical protein